MGKFTPHAILQRKGKRGSVVREKRENTRDRDRREELEKLWKHREFRTKEKESNLLP
jgi:hypothetical protein